jgi:F0F1-type ATP synthase epsilon subunit
MNTTTPFHVIFTQPGQTNFDGQATEVYFPGTDGEFGILFDHQQTVAALIKGEVKIISPDSSSVFCIQDGVAFIGRDQENIFRVSIVARGVEPVRQERTIFRSAEAER